MKVIAAKNAKLQFPIAIVTSLFNEDVTELLFQGAIDRLKELAVPDHLITAVWVPGAIEIPLIAQQLASSRDYEAIICLGAVIRGETSHYDYVCKQVSDGCQKVSLEHNIPVIFGILTTDDETQAMDRVGGKHGHKGREAADCAMTMVALTRQLQGKNGE